MPTEDELAAVVRQLQDVAARLAAAVERMFTGSVRQNYRLTHQQLEQRRAASAKAAAKRMKPKVYRKSHRKSAPETAAESTTSPNPGTEITGKLSTPPSTLVFQEYAAAFKLRYATFPVRNAKVNGMLAQFIKRVPMAEAPEIAKFYVGFDDPLYVKSMHPVELLLRDAEKVRASWATGRKVAPVNGVAAATIAKPWWESWSSLVEQGRDLGLELEDGANPTLFKNQVLRAAFVAGRLPIEVATKLGVPTHA